MCDSNEHFVWDLLLLLLFCPSMALALDGKAFSSIVTGITMVYPVTGQMPGH